MFMEMLSNVVKAAAQKRGLGGVEGVMGGGGSAMTPAVSADPPMMKFFKDQVGGRTDNAMSSIDNLKNLTPQNVGQSVLNRSQQALSQIRNPMQTINNRLVDAFDNDERGKLSTIRDIKSGMPTPGSNNSLRSGGSNILNGLGQNTINTPPPKQFNTNQDEDLLEQLLRLSAKRTGFPLEQRMMGGPTDEGQAYLVGEDGPEVFVSPQDGQIIPNPNTVMRESEMQGMGEVVRESELAFSPKQLELMNYMRSLPPGGLNDILGDRNAAVRESEFQPSVGMPPRLDTQGKKSISDEYLESIRQDPDF